MRIQRWVALLIAMLLLIPTQALARSAILDEPAAFSDRAGGVKPQFSASNHVLMLRADGRLLGWGDNRYGQLGLGDSAADKYNTPTEIPFFKDKAPIKQIATLENASYALLVNGEVYSCGQGAGGRLGQGLLVDFKEWRLITGSVDLGIFALYTNPNSASVYALTADDTLLAVGQNDQGQLGIGSTDDALSFATVMDNADIRSLHIGKDFAVIVHMDGVSKAAGRLDNAITGIVPLKMIQNYKANWETSSTWHAMGKKAIKFSSAIDIANATFPKTMIVYNNANDPINASKNGAPVFSQIVLQGLVDCLSLQHGNSHGILQRSDGSYIGWGEVSKKQLLGQTDVTDGVVLTALNAKIAELELQGYEDIAVHVAGDSNYLTAKSTITNNYKTWGWGSNTRGKLGVDSELASFDTLTEITALEGFAVDDIVAGIGNVFFINNDTGEIRSTGDNAYGQLGLGETYADMTSNVPRFVPTVKFSETAAPPSPVNAIHVPSETAVDSDIVVDWGNSAKGRTAMPTADSYLLTRVVNGAASSVVYQGDATTFTDKALKDWTTAEYEVYTVNYVGDLSQPVRSSAITIKAVDGGGSGGGNNGGNNGGTGGGADGNGTSGGGTTNVTVRPDITVNMPKLDATAGAVAQQSQPQYNMLPYGNGEPYQLIVNMPDAPDYTQLAVTMLEMMDKQQKQSVQSMTPPAIQPQPQGGTRILDFLLALCAVLLMLLGTVYFAVATVPYVKARSLVRAEELKINRIASLTMRTTGYAAQDDDDELSAESVVSQEPTMSDCDVPTPDEVLLPYTDEDEVWQQPLVTSPDTPPVDAAADLRSKMDKLLGDDE